MLAIIEELAVVIIICAVAFVHVAAGPVFFGSRFVAAFVRVVLAVLVFRCVVLPNTLPKVVLVQSLCCVVILLSTADCILNRSRKSILLIGNRRSSRLLLLLFHLLNI
tara:strand:- start:266 stop:589 length:324 start_codon:yes stop_codon:yes gene_type:complete